MADYMVGSVKKVLEDPSQEAAASAAKNIVKRASKQGLGSVSAIINEIERFQKRYEGEEETMVDDALSAIFGE
jgi:hypothetical protein